MFDHTVAGLGFECANHNIEATFVELCATLRETQPTDGSYMLTINDICADS